MSTVHRPSRRHVLKWAAASTGILVGGALVPGFGISSSLAAELGSGDTGILNYALALEQLEAAFYTQVVATPFADMNERDRITLTQLRDHEVSHAEFLRDALGSDAIGQLEVDFSSVNFSSRESVLETADIFENLGVSAYNGAGQLLQSPQLLAAAGSIVSIEARHAAAIADLIQGAGPMAAGRGQVDDQALDVFRLPSMVLEAAGPFIRTPVSASALP